MLRVQSTRFVQSQPIRRPQFAAGTKGRLVTGLMLGAALAMVTPAKPVRAQSAEGDNPPAPREVSDRPLTKREVLDQAWSQANAFFWSDLPTKDPKPLLQKLLTQLPTGDEEKDPVKMAAAIIKLRWATAAVLQSPELASLKPEIVNANVQYALKGLAHPHPVVYMEAQTAVAELFHPRKGTPDLTLAQEEQLITAFRRKRPDAASKNGTTATNKPD